MYFLSKFCRICVQTGVELNDIEMLDFDYIKLSEKLETCAKLVVTEKSMCSQICTTCTNKLRVSYHFQEMCNKSTKIIQGYLQKLTEYTESIEDEKPFENWDLEVALTPIPRLGIVNVAKQMQKSSGDCQDSKDFESNSIESKNVLLENVKIDKETVETNQKNNEVKNVQNELPVSNKSKFLIEDSDNFLSYTEKLKLHEKGREIDHEKKLEARNFGKGPIYTEVRRVAKIPPQMAQESRQQTIMAIKNEPVYEEVIKVVKNASSIQTNEEIPTKVKKFEPIPTERIKFGKIPKSIQETQETFTQDLSKIKEFQGIFTQASSSRHKPPESSPESRIRVRNFENEPIQNQRPIANQNVLSEIEKVVNDVPATFKKQQKSRITKEKRCSLLKQLLAPSPNDKQIKERDKSLGFGGTAIKREEGEGLKNILNFTENYQFAIKNASNLLDNNSNIYLSHIDKLKEFSRNYFKRKSFQEFKDTVMYIIEHKDDYDDSFDDSDFNDDESNEDTDTAEEENNFEEVLVEPDIGVKDELMEYEQGTQSTFDYIVDANFDDELGLIEPEDEPTNDPKEPPQTPTKPVEDRRNMVPISDTKNNVKIKEEPHADYSDSDNPLGIRVKPEFVELSEFQGLASSDEGECSSKNSEDNKNPSPGPSYSTEFESYLSKYSSDSVNMLDHLVSSYPMGKKVFSPLNVRCRTRGQPYISPRLMDQFKFQCFRCDKCNRNFKSPGYLKAHTSKVH